MFAFVRNKTVLYIPDTGWSRIKVQSTEQFIQTIVLFCFFTKERNVSICIDYIWKDTLDLDNCFNFFLFFFFEGVVVVFAFPPLPVEERNWVASDRGDKITHFSLHILFEPFDFCTICRYCRFFYTETKQKETKKWTKNISSKLQISYFPLAKIK